MFDKETIMTRLALLIYLILIYMSVGDIENGSITYKSLIDEYKGFYKVFNEQTGKYITYENYMLDINVGDNVIWINDDATDTVTIISEQNLWNDDEGTLVYTGRRINYTFGSTGIYTFHLKENESLQQIIIVSNADNITNMTEDNITDTTNMTEDNITDTTNMTEDNITDTTSMTEDNNVNENINVLINMTEDNASIILDNPILAPLDISKNFKRKVIISFIIIIIIFFIKEDGEKS